MYFFHSLDRFLAKDCISLVTQFCICTVLRGTKSPFGFSLFKVLLMLVKSLFLVFYKKNTRLHRTRKQGTESACQSSDWLRGTRHSDKREVAKETEMICSSLRTGVRLAAWTIQGSLNTTPGTYMSCCRRLGSTPPIQSYSCCPHSPQTRKEHSGASRA